MNSLARLPSFAKSLKNILSFLACVFMTASTGVASIVASYDQLSRLTGITYPNGSRIEYSYDAAGNRTSYLATAPGSTVAENLALTNGMAQQISISHPGAAGSSYEWYRNGVKIATTSEPRLPSAPFSPAGAGAYRVIIREPGGAISIVELTVQVKGLTYESWLRHKEGPAATPADPGFARQDSAHSDGIPNIVKYAVGIGPSDDAYDALPRPVLIRPDGGIVLGMELDRLIKPLDIRYVIEGKKWRCARFLGLCDLPRRGLGW